MWQHIFFVQPHDFGRGNGPRGSMAAYFLYFFVRMRACVCLRVCEIL